MSPNPNYEAGRRFEYERMKYWREVEGHTVMRTAGSHGPFDLISISKGGYVGMIQCKLVATRAEADKLIKDFKANPPFLEAHFHQTMEVKVKGSKDVISWVV